MEEVKELTSFFSAIREDHRIGPTHISLYMVLFNMYILNQFQNPIYITRASVMTGAKINGLATYHKCIRELVEFGYIEYIRSFNPSVYSQVRILCLS